MGGYTLYKHINKGSVHLFFLKPASIHLSLFFVPCALKKMKLLPRKIR